VLTLGGKNCFVTVDWLLFDEEDDVCESWVVDNSAHVSDEGVDSLIVYLVFL